MTQPNSPFNRPQKPQQPTQNGGGKNFPSRPQPPQQKPFGNGANSPAQNNAEQSKPAKNFPSRPQPPQSDNNPFLKKTTESEPPQFQPRVNNTNQWNDTPPVNEEPQETQIPTAPGLTEEQRDYLDALKRAQQQQAGREEQPFTPDYNSFEKDSSPQDFSIPAHPQRKSEVEEEPVEPRGKGKGKREKKPKPVKKKKSDEDLTPREQKYAGERKKVLWIRFTFWAFTSTMVVVGLASLVFLPMMRPTAEQLTSAAAEAANYTGFPTESGERFVLDFAEDYWTFSTEQGIDERTAIMKRYITNEELLEQVTPKTMSPEEFEEFRDANNLTKDGRDLEYSEYVIKQEISDGPYVVKIQNVTESHSIYTVKLRLAGQSNDLYWDVPVLYSPKNLSLTLAGPPSFSKVLMNRGSENTELDYVASFASDGQSDEELATEFQGDLEAYLSAWAQSDETLIERYTADDAQENALRGLGGQVQFSNIESFYIEPENLDEAPETEYQRKAEVFVTWEIPNAETGAVGIKYTQQYRILLLKNPEGKWSVYDIQNFAVFK